MSESNDTTTQPQQIITTESGQQIIMSADGRMVTPDGQQVSWYYLIDGYWRAELFYSHTESLFIVFIKWMLLTYFHNYFLGNKYQ